MKLQLLLFQQYNGCKDLRYSYKVHVPNFLIFAIILFVCLMQNIVINNNKSRYLRSLTSNQSIKKYAKNNNNRHYLQNSEN